ncbi:MAG: response regulator transcription factor [Pseudomonadota bacterium]|nr:response regulator transcription factor [Pseudomonadota bacterium]
MDAGIHTIIIADDHPLFGVALRLGVQRVAPDAEVIEVDSFAALRDAAHRHPNTSLVLLDLMMPDVEGLSALQFLRDEFPRLRVAIVSGAPAQTWVRAAEALGAVAFVPKSTAPTQTQNILRTLLEGGSWWPEPKTISAAADSVDSRIERLSRQELRILLRIKDGKLNKQIADELSIAESTVKTHITMLLRKLDLQSRTQAAVLAQRVLTGS